MSKRMTIKGAKVGCLYCLLFLISCPGLTQTNQSEKPLFLSISPYIGKFQVHTKSLYPYNGVHPTGIELEASQLILTKRIRERFGTFIKVGFGFNYLNFNHEDLGHTITTLAYLEPFLKTSGHWRISAKVGAGLAYLSNPYHATFNPQNLTYSTHLAFPLYAGANAYYFFTKQWAIKVSASYQHISNGGIKQPNLGINYPVIALGIEHTFNAYAIPPKRALTNYSKNKRLDLLLGYSLKEDTTHTNTRHVVNVQGNYSMDISRINALNLACLVEYQQAPALSQTPKELSVAPLVGHEFLFGQIFFGQQIGVYLIRGEEASNALLQNYYLRYKVNRRIIAGINLKAHGRVADYLAIQLGVRL